MSVELERRAFLKAAAAACVAVRAPYALAAWCSPSKMKEMEADEEGGKSTKELEALLDAVCIAGREMGKILGELGKRSLGGENENPVEEGFNEV